MLIKKAFDIYAKLAILGVHSRFDVCSMWEANDLNVTVPGIYHAKTSSGKVPILKVLFTNTARETAIIVPTGKTGIKVKGFPLPLMSW